MGKNYNYNKNNDQKEQNDSFDGTKKHSYNANFSAPNFIDIEQEKIESNIRKLDETKFLKNLKNEQHKLLTQKDINSDFFDPSKTPSSLGPLVKEGYLPSKTPNLSPEELSRLENEHSFENVSLNQKLKADSESDTAYIKALEAKYINNEKEIEIDIDDRTNFKDIWEEENLEKPLYSAVNSITINDSNLRSMQVLHNVDFTDIKYDELQDGNANREKQSRIPHLSGVERSWWQKIKTMFNSNKFRNTNPAHVKTVRENIYHTGENSNYNLKVKRLSNGKTRIRTIRKRHSLDWTNWFLTCGRIILTFGLLFTIISTFAFGSWFSTDSLGTNHFNIYSIFDKTFPNFLNIADDASWSSGRVFTLLFTLIICILFVTPIFVSSNKFVLLIFSTIIGVLSLVWFSYSFYGFYLNDNQIVIGNAIFWISQLIWLLSIIGSGVIMTEIFLAS